MLPLSLLPVSDWACLSSTGPKLKGHRPSASPGCEQLSSTPSPLLERLDVEEDRVLVHPDQSQLGLGFAGSFSGEC